MKTFETWLKDNRDEELPRGSVSGAWFAEQKLPMVVECTNCMTTMCVVSALIDDDDQVYCAQCAGG